MPLILPNDKQKILSVLEKNPYLHMYSIGDLDDLFRPLTDWYGWQEAGELQSIICVYKGGDVHTLMGLTDMYNKEKAAFMINLLKGVSSRLPSFFYAHLSPGLEEQFRDTHEFESSAAHYKMALTDKSRLKNVKNIHAERLKPEDIPGLLELYNESYAGNWFDPEMFDMNRYFGIRKGDTIISVAGTHVYSPENHASAIGNITTHPDYRGRGFGTGVTAALGYALVSEGMRVGLNVSQNNKSAIACYKKAGFTLCGEYGEFSLRLKSR
jgi:ribosomal protein S18 acetylase RimI-like enzyme